MMAAMTTAAWIALAFLAGFTLAALFAAAAFRALVELHKDERQVAVDEREQWRSERRELITRALHPQVIPTGAPRVPPDPDDLERRRRAARDFAQVGKIVPASTATNGDGDDLELP